MLNKRRAFADAPWGALREELSKLEEGDRLRQPRVESADSTKDFCSNDYLGFGAELLSIEARGGAGASALVTGHRAAHRDGAASIAEWLGVEAVTLFSSTYAANVGVLQTLGGPGSLIISDALNHASIIDGCRLSRAEIRVVPHADVNAVAHVLEETAGRFRQRWVFTEAYFSMDGDIPDLAGLSLVTRNHGAGLVVDEAHSLGVFGPGGRGLCARDGVVPDVLIGGLGKSIGLQGGFVAGSTLLQRALWNRARSFVFSTALSPLIAAALPDRVGEVARAEERRSRLFQNVAAFAEDAGLSTSPVGPIVPWVFGDDRATVDASQLVSSRGFVVRPIRPPTVPCGTSRLRVTLTASHRLDDVRELAKVLQQTHRVSRETR